MFEKASRIKLRFDTSRGLVSVEDLWDLPLVARNRPNLDDIARELYKQLKNDDDVSFVLKEKKSDETVQLRFDIVRHIIEVRLAEEEAAKKAKANKEQKQKLLEIIANKQDEVLKGKNIEELMAMVNELEA